MHKTNIKIVIKAVIAIAEKVAEAYVEKKVKR